jgi:hypothetical protein
LRLSRSTWTRSYLDRGGPAPKIQIQIQPIRFHTHRMEDRPGAVNAAYPSGAQKATDRSAGANAADYRRGYQTPGRGPAMDREG